LLDAISKSIEPFRSLYNQGEKAIEAEKASMLAAGKTEGEIAKRVSTMRKELALQVREASGAVQKKAAELFDLLRGNKERPGYESLIAAGKTDAEIIASATHTNKFVNALPRGLRWTGRALLVVQAGVSIYVVVEASPEKRPETAAREAGGFVGGVVGAEIAEAACLAVGILTEGVGLVVCGLVAVAGGVAGFEAGRRGGPLILENEIEKQKRLQEGLKTCEQLSGIQKFLCQVGAHGRFEP
jgi:hypothetical protein